MQDKVDLVAHSSSAEHSDSVISALALPIILALFITFNYKINKSIKTSPVVHLYSTWYNSFNTAGEIAQGIAILTIIPLYMVGVLTGSNTTILIAVGIAGLLLSLYLVPLIAHSNHKTNISSEISPVVQSSSVEHGNKPRLPSGKRYAMQLPLENLELASRCPRPRMIVSA